jgi:hypothetical protein
MDRSWLNAENPGSKPFADQGDIPGWLYNAEDEAVHSFVNDCYTEKNHLHESAFSFSDGVGGDPTRSAGILNDVLEYVVLLMGEVGGERGWNGRSVGVKSS